MQGDYIILSAESLFIFRKELLSFLKFCDFAVKSRRREFCGTQNPLPGGWSHNIKLNDLT